MPPKRNQNRSKSHNKSRSKEAAEVNAMADCVLPHDMMIAILARLPVKSLVRFKCVCKPWRSLVSNPNFIKLHSSLGATARASISVQSLLLTCPILGIDPNRVSPVEAEHPYEFFLDHCNGLVCMAHPLFTQDVILWNPATNFWKILPHSRESFGAAEMVSIGFGCNAEGDDFKVVRIFCFKGRKMKVCVEVYSSKADSWRTMKLDFKFRVAYCKNHVIVNGNPYWVACFAERVNEYGEAEEARALLGFDSTNMEFKAVALPILDSFGEGLPFVNWEGCIAALDCVKRDGGDWLEGIDVWCYDEGEKVWSRKKRFAMMPHLQLQVDQCLDCSSSGKIVGGCTNGKLFMFDPETGCVGVSEMRRGKGCSFQLFAYDESLTCVKGMAPAAVGKREERMELKDIDGFFVSSFNHRNGQIACYYALAL